MIQITAFAILGTLLNTAPAPQSNRVESLMAASTVVRSIDPQDEDYSDLMPLIDKIGNSDIVVLGENSHSDGATSQAKCRMIRFLHQKMGFDVLVWEAGMYDCEYMNTALRGDIPLYDAKGILMRGGWATSQYVHDAFAYARSTWKTSNPLEMSGFDDGQRPPNGAVYLSRFIKGLLDPVPELLLSDQEKAKLDEVLKRVIRFWQQNTPTIDEPERVMQRKFLLDLFDRIDSHRETLEKVHGKRDVDLARAVLSSLLVSEESDYCWSQARKNVPGEWLTRWNIQRDKQMATNLSFLVNERYRGRKMIIWCATAHLARETRLIESLKYPGTYQTPLAIVQAGEYFHQQVGRRLYTIAFTAGIGKIGSNFPHSNPPSINEEALAVPPSDSLEEICMRTNEKFLFTDMRSLPSSHWLRTTVQARPLGYLDAKAEWWRVFDAFFFIREMFPESYWPKDKTPG
ncbi:MAG: erythromycin esterase family protein [Fimbriimonadaceae bacterium]|nr:erythromycin esterase family protein [Fimbriimonadaceae bacterium]